MKQYNGVPPYHETRAYIAKIVRDFNAKKRAQMKAAAAANTNVAGKLPRRRPRPRVPSLREESQAAASQRAPSRLTPHSHKRSKVIEAVRRVLLAGRFFCMITRARPKSMSKKRFLITALVLVVLGALVYLAGKDLEEI